MPGLTDPNANTASIRTAWLTGVLTGLSYLAHRLFDIEISTSDPLMIAVAIGVVGVAHRLFLVLSETVPYFGYILFGINRSPSYTSAPPAVPVLADEGQDAGFVANDTIWTIVGILVIIALAFYIIPQIN